MTRRVQPCEDCGVLRGAVQPEEGTASGRRAARSLLSPEGTRRPVGWGPESKGESVRGTRPYSEGSLGSGYSVRNGKPR